MRRLFEDITADTTLTNRAIPPPFIVASVKIPRSDQPRFVSSSGQPVGSIVTTQLYGNVSLGDHNDPHMSSPYFFIRSFGWSLKLKCSYKVFTVCRGRALHPLEKSWPAWRLGNRAKGTICFCLIRERGYESEAVGSWAVIWDAGKWWQYWRFGRFSNSFYAFWSCEERFFRRLVNCACWAHKSATPSPSASMFELRPMHRSRSSAPTPKSRRINLVCRKVKIIMISASLPRCSGRGVVWSSRRQPHLPKCPNVWAEPNQ